MTDKNMKGKHIKTLRRKLGSYVYEFKVGDNLQTRERSTKIKERWISLCSNKNLC
jgi:hypothetical protein